MVETYRFQVGDFECIAINDGIMSIADADRFFHGASEDELIGVLAQYGREPGMFSVPCICLIIMTGDNIILIDAGGGEDLRKEHGLGYLTDGLEAEGIAPDELDIVILSHADFDHTGGLIDANGQAAFPNARYMMSRLEFESLTQATDLTQYGEIAKKKLLAIESRFEHIEPDTVVVPGIQVIATPGHTDHHVSIVINSGETYLICPADALVHPISVEHTDWHPAWNIDTVQTQDSLRKLLQFAVENNALVHGYHHPFPGLGRIHKDDDGYHWEAEIIS